MTRVPAAVVATLLLLAGCVSAPPGDPGAGQGMPDSPGGENPVDPAGDPLGWESGYWYDEGIDVTPADGFDRAELDRIVARTMARLERLREREFTEAVSVEVITREEYRRRNVFSFQPDPVRDQLWEALFVVGERTESADELDDVYGGSVVGYYSGGDIVIVSEAGSAAQVRPSTLSHELAHALQDQHFDRPRSDGSTDGSLAARSLPEGEANYLMDRYLGRCGAEWRCIPREQGGGGGGPSTDAVFLSVFVPYSDGPTLVDSLVERDGWAAVDRAWRDPPVSTEQVIHPRKYPDETPATVRVPDRSKSGWKRVGGDTVGEATLFASMVANGVVPRDHLTTDARRYNYSHPVTAGWDGDRLVAYRDGDRFGYVFETTWDTREDARQFLEAYRRVLTTRGAERVGGDRYRIPEGSEYGDAFRVVREGRTVRVVNAPSVDLLDAVHRPED